MGFGMTSNLLKAGHKIIAYDIDFVKLDNVSKLGAEKAKSIQELSKSVEVIILCLPHPNISKEIISKLSQKKIRIIIETSTLTPEDSSQFKTLLEKKGIEYLCAPMLAGKKMALEGHIDFIVEGKEDVFNRYKKIFEPMGKTSFMGDVPNATLTKLAYNLCRYSNVATALTVINFLKKYSKNLSPIYDVLTDGSFDNFGKIWKEEMEEVAIENKQYKFTGSKIPLKDLSLVISLAMKQKLSPKLFKAILEVYESLGK